MPADYVASRNIEPQTTEMAAANNGSKTAKSHHLQNTHAAIMPTRDDTDESSYGGAINNNDFSSNSALQ